jgi:dTDP-4-dehydrorhamnose reductase
MTAARLLLIGRRGQVADAVQEAAAARGWDVVACGRDTPVATDPASLAATVAAGPWTAVINAAAYTAVDQAERAPDAAFALNRDLPAALARACAAAGLPLLHLSTDYVFDGTNTAPYAEDDPVNPLNVYGASKAAGEAAIRAVCPAHVILRTSWVFSGTGQNFVRTMLRLGAERPELAVVADQHGRPTAAADIAEALLDIVAALRAGKQDGFGTFHFAGAGPTTWHGFATAIFAAAARRTGAAPPLLRAIPTAAYPTEARRPPHSVLGTARIARVHGCVPRPWTLGLEAALDRLLGTETRP